MGWRAAADEHGVDPRLMQHPRERQMHLRG
jgi:hypothetical protein